MEDITNIIKERALTLQSEKDLDALLERVGDARVVMLGEASHGTKEYYDWRAAITRRLILEKDFSFVAVEGDWPDCFEINRYVKSYAGAGPNANQVLQTFTRWPTWMWANEEVREFVEWLHEYNAGREFKPQCGFYGLDLYSLNESMNAIVTYARKTDPQILDFADKAYKCFRPYGKDLYSYAYGSAFTRERCEIKIAELFTRLRTHLKIYEDDQEQTFNAEQNARVIENAEGYYRIMLLDYAESWNIRDAHMFETLDRLLEYYGPDTKAIVWAHNTHIGDARATDMIYDSMINIGQIAREKYGEDKVVLVGFSSYSGSVIAGEVWDAPMRVMRMPEARAGTWEKLLHDIDGSNKMLITQNIRDVDTARVKRDHRAIGVVYNPDFEVGNYVTTDLPARYDVFIYLDQTHALEPLPVGHIEVGEVPETFPAGV